MRPTERRENGGKRKWRQIRQENFKREIREKGKRQNEKGHSRKRETGQTTGKEV